MTLIRLTGPKRDQIRKALVIAFTTPPAMEDLLTLLDRSFIQLNLTGYNFMANVLVLVEEAEREGWLVELMEMAHRVVPKDHTIEAILAEMRPYALPAGVSHFQVCRLTGGYVMVNRAKLRASLEVISAPLGGRILVVTGGAKSGKSHSVQFIAYLQEALNSFTLIPIDLEAYKRLFGPGKTIEPFDIARSLVKKLRYDMVVPDPPNDQQWSRWVLEFCDDFETFALTDPQVRWVVIDAFNSVVVTQAAFDLIKELAIRISKTLIRFRLVLLGYEDFFPAWMIPTVQKEDIRPIGVSDLVRFFAEAFQQQGLEVDEPKLESTVAGILDDIDPAGEDFLVLLQPRLIAELGRAAVPPPP